AAAAPLTLTIPGGMGISQAQITINVVGDLLRENDETFTVNLTNAAGGVITGGTATGTIIDDDQSRAPGVTISDVTDTEGSGGQKAFVLKVDLSQPSGQPVTVDYTTAPDNGTATANVDYVPLTPATLTFNPGETEKTVTVLVNGDTVDETNEQFFVNLSNPV